MKHFPAATLTAVILLAAAGTVRAQTTSRKVAPTAQAVVRSGQISLNPGRFEDSRYISDLFGFSLTIPRGWVTQDLATRRDLLDTAKEVIEERASEQKKEEFEASLNRGMHLFSASKYDPKTPPPGPNASLTCMVERLPTGVVKTGDAYLAAMLDLARVMKVKIELTGPVRTEKVGGVSFTAADVKLTLGTAVIPQKYYVTIRKGYALMFSYAYLEEADLKPLEEILKSVKFN
jgi:hypothetical protein